MSFEDWVAEVEEFRVPSDIAGLASAVWLHDRYEARLASAAAEFATSGEWDMAGFTSPVVWMVAQGLTPRDAGELLRMGQKMRALPVTASAWLAGGLTGAQVRVICAQVIDRHIALFASHEAALIPTFAALPFADTVRAMSWWRAKADAFDDGREPRAEPCEARLSTTLDDRGLLTASLDAEGVALATAALNLADSHDLTVPAAERRGQALKDVWRWFLDNQNVRAGGRHRPHMNIIVKDDPEHTGQLEGFDAESGVRIDSPTLQRLACDCEFHRVLMSAKGAVLDYGRSTKTPSPDLYNAVVARDQHCRWDGCDRPASWCHAHHVEWWGRDRGVTSTKNLVLLCARHHSMIHRKGFNARLYLDGRFEITTPWGDTRSTRPPGALDPPELTWIEDAPDPAFELGEEQRRAEFIRARVRALVDA